MSRLPADDIGVNEPFDVLAHCFADPERESQVFLGRCRGSPPVDNAVRAMTFKLRPMAASWVTADRSASSSLSAAAPAIAGAHGRASRRRTRPAYRGLRPAGATVGCRRETRRTVTSRIAGDRGWALDCGQLVASGGEQLFDEALQECRFGKLLARGRGRKAFLEIGADPGREMRAAIFHAAHLNQTAAERLSCNRV
jgi:hypothetical protein